MARRASPEQIPTEGEVTQSSYRANVLILAISQALTLSAIVLAMALGAILGGMLAPDKGLATLPIAAMVIGTAVASLPASILMRKHGRRAGFLLGAVLGIGGSLLCALALYEQSFAAFVAGHLLLGSYQGFANYYRFPPSRQRASAMPARPFPSWWPVA